MPTIQTSDHDSTPSITESSPIAPNQSNPTGEGTSAQSNPIDEGVSASNTIVEGNSNRSHVRTLVTLTYAGLQSSKTYSNRILECFKSELDPNGIN